MPPGSTRQPWLSEGTPPSPSQRQSKNPPDLSAARARRKGAGLGRADAGVTQTKRGHQYAESHPEPEPEPKLECEENGERFRIMSAAPESVSEVDTSRPEDAQALQDINTLRRENTALLRELATSGPNAAATIENLRSGNEELCGLLIRRDHTIAELTEDNVRLQAQCTQLVADRGADQSLISALKSRAVQAEDRSDALRIEMDQLRQHLLVNQRVMAASVRKLQLNSLLRSFNAWAEMVEHATNVRNLGTKVVKRIRCLGLAAALSSWREIIVDRVATKQLLVKVVQRIKNMALSRIMLQWRGSVKYSAHIRAVAHKAVHVWCRRAMVETFDRWLRWHEHTVALKRVGTKVIKRIQCSVLAAALSSWREATVDRVATRQLLVKVVQRIKNAALSKTFDCWALWWETQVRDREMRRVSAEQEACVDKLTALNRKAKKQQMMLVVQKLRLRTVAQAMSSWRGYVLHAQVSAANSNLLEGLNEAQGALFTGLAEAEAAQRAAAESANKQKMILAVQKLRLRTVAQAMSTWRAYVLHLQVSAANSRLDAAVMENRTATARCADLVGAQHRLESAMAELESRAAAAESSSTALAAEVDSLRDVNIQLDRAATESTRQNTSLAAEKHGLAEANAELQKSAAAAERQLAVVSKEMSSVRDELTVSKTQHQEMLVAMNQLNDDLDRSLVREQAAAEETAKLRSEVMAIAQLLKEKGITIEPSRFS